MLNNCNFYAKNSVSLRQTSSFMFYIYYASTNRCVDINCLLKIFDSRKNKEFLDISLHIARDYARGGGLIDTIMFASFDGKVKEKVEEKINELLNKEELNE